MLKTLKRTRRTKTPISFVSPSSKVDLNSLLFASTLSLTRIAFRDVIGFPNGMLLVLHYKSIPKSLEHSDQRTWNYLSRPYFVTDVPSYILYLKPYSPVACLEKLLDRDLVLEPRLDGDHSICGLLNAIVGSTRPV
jgi:hypothetical protein